MNPRAGFVYILALVVVLVSAAVAVTLAREVGIRSQAQQTATARSQCRTAALGVLRAITADLAATMATSTIPGLTTVTPTGEVVGDCTVVLVGRDPAGATLRCGLIPATSRLAADHASVAQFAMLPGMTTAIGAALVDWRDGDDDVDQNGGAERTDGAYAGASIPFAPRNADPELMDELRLVRDVTDAIYFGEDRNANGVLDSGEDDNGDGTLTSGLRDLLVVNSHEPADTSKLVNAIASPTDRPPTAWNNLVGRLRQVGDAKRGAALAAVAQGHGRFTSRVQLIIDLGLSESETDSLWPELFERGNRMGLIDAWSCRNAVLTALVGEELAATIIAARPTTQPTSPWWLAQALGTANAATYGALFTHGTWQFDADLLAVRNDGGGWARIQATIDCALGTPRVTQVRPAESQGWPFPWATLAQIRRGDAGTDLATFLTTAPR
jgi:hypothetical protein